ncbi:alcohol oxidase [Ceratobasidium sp. AG-I]|nr:alcohol oxidase [Ceratobasidium sp. AG-I]
MNAQGDMANYPKEVDIIFVGGGTAACVAAGRLAAANPGLEILLIERGPNNLDNPAITIPGLALANLAPPAKLFLFWQGNKSDAVNGRGPSVATGGVLGGGSSINLMTYVRASASDFDDWNTPGWGSADLIPLLQKMETYHPTQSLATHGYDGPMNISYQDEDAVLAQQYLDICIRRGVPLVKDMMDLKTGYGCGRFAKWIHPITKHRQDTAHQYIHRQAHGKSLSILTGVLVARILFDGTKATGVEVVANKEQDADADQTPRAISARKLVVVCAGAMGSPLVLQRSGIGMAERLNKLGVNAVVDLPDVGAHYQDHSNLMPAFYVSEDTETFDYLLSKEPGIIDQYLHQFANGQGPLDGSPADTGSKLRPTAAELQTIGPAFNKVWKEYFEPAPDKPVGIQFMIHAFLGPPSANPNNDRIAMICNMLTYPASRGYIHITSTDPYAPPDFETGLLAEQTDVDAHIWMYKQCREIARRMPNYRGDYPPFHPSFPEDSAAACIRLSGPPASEVADLVYTPEDAVAIEQFVRRMGDSNFHPIGTVRMKPREQGGCVDARLNVHGTQNLKVADLSILPANVGANTNSTALLIGEKAAILIAEDLGLKLS